jgi:hypothetical protein
MATFIAQNFADAFVDVYVRGLRDLRSPGLAPYYVETPRSLVNSADVDERYSKVVDALADDTSEAAFLFNPPFPDQSGSMPLNEFVDLFLPTSGQATFIKMLNRQGLELTLQDDLEEDADDQLALRNAELSDLSIEQEADGNFITPDYINNVLEQSQLQELEIVSTFHFADDEAPNDAYDADEKAGERVAQLTTYIPDLIGALS